MREHQDTLKDFFGIPSTRPDAATEATPLPAGALSVQLQDAKVDPAAMLAAVGDSLGPLLDVRFSTVLAGGWAKARTLREYRQKSLAAPDETFLLSMAKHTIQSKHTPSIELLMNDTLVDALPFEISLQVALEGMQLKIQAGRIMELRPGRATASGKVSCRGYVVAEQAAKPLNLPGVLTLGEGVEISA